MRHVNSVYTQAFDRGHSKAGHLRQGRFKAILVDRDASLREVCRYEGFTPMRAGMVSENAQWPWSSYRMQVGQVPSPEWVDSAGLHPHMLGYMALAAATYGLPRVQRSEPMTLSQWLSTSASHDRAFPCAHTQSGLGMTAIVREVGLIVTSVSSLIGRSEATLKAGSSA